MAGKARGAEAADAVRSAVDRTFQATVGQGAQVTRDRAQELVDELTGAAARMRDLVEELRPAAADELSELRQEVAELRARVAALEGSTGAEGATGRGASGPPASERGSLPGSSGSAAGEA
jgi:polyhydroxyalkanoate synthesis regulator phasin